MLHVVVHWLGLAALLGVALQFVVPPTMLALLLEEAVTVAGLHEGSSSSISGGLGLVGGCDRVTGMASVISLPPAFSPAGY